jgi:hypothetical protein
MPAAHLASIEGACKTLLPLKPEARDALLGQVVSDDAAFETALALGVAGLARRGRSWSVDRGVGPASLSERAPRDTAAAWLATLPSRIEGLDDARARMAPFDRLLLDALGQPALDRLLVEAATLAGFTLDAHGNTVAFGPAVDASERARYVFESSFVQVET